MLLIIGGMLIASCKKQLDDSYLNPNNPIDGGIESILPNVINQMTSTATPPTGGETEQEKRARLLGEVGIGG